MTGFALRPTSAAELAVLAHRGSEEPIGCDISDYSDEWGTGFLAGQVNAFQVLARRLGCDCIAGCQDCQT